MSDLNALSKLDELRKENYSLREKVVDLKLALRHAEELLQTGETHEVQAVSQENVLGESFVLLKGGKWLFYEKNSLRRTPQPGDKLIVRPPQILRFA